MPKSIQPLKKLRSMNHVNLIGKVCSKPKILEMENGRRIARFTLATDEIYLDKNGETKTRSHWHRMTAWGNWVRVCEELVDEGSELAVQGSLVTRFYSSGISRRFSAEVEVNDLTIL
jgi:single-strand DNA-binding protein